MIIGCVLHLWLIEFFLNHISFNLLILTLWYLPLSIALACWLYHCLPLACRLPPIHSSVVSIVTSIIFRSVAFFLCFLFPGDFTFQMRTLAVAREHCPKSVVHWESNKVKIFTGNRRLKCYKLDLIFFLFSVWK